MSPLFLKKKISVICFVTFFLTGWVHSAFAQMDHSSHMGMGGSSKPPNTCVSTGLECANAATPFFNSDGTLFLAWTAGGELSVAQSQDFGKSFSVPVVLASHGKSLDAGGDARPQIVADGFGNVFVTYAFFKDTNWNAQVNFVRSTDGGKTFSQPQSIVADSSSQRFPSLAITPSGSLFLSWIDKRLVAAAKGTGEKRLGGSIAYTFSNDFGKTFKPERIANENSCECCRIGTSLDMWQQPVIAYRAIFPGGIRDHATQVISEKNAGIVRRVSDDEWKTDACPHHGPSIAVSGTGRFHVAWYTQGGKRSGVFYANSSNQGITYSKPIRIGAEGANVSRPYLLALGKRVWLVWKEFDGNNSLVYLKQSEDDGKNWLAPKIISKTSGYSDHPLLVSQQGEVFLSWLTRLDGYQLHKISQ
jgi:BNR repeat-like domain